MNNQERAKQFLPFDAMKGLSEALRKKEERRTRMARRELSEEEAEVLSRALLSVHAGDRVRIEIFRSGHYLNIEGTLEEIILPYRTLKIGKEKISFDDIFSLRIL